MCGLGASTSGLGTEAGYFVKQIYTIMLHRIRQSSWRAERLLALQKRIFSLCSVIKMFSN